MLEQILRECPQLTRDDVPAMVGRSRGNLRLCPSSSHYSSRTRSHPGKLRTVNRALNPASHDDGAPGSSVLKQAIDDLRDLKKRYIR